MDECGAPQGVAVGNSHRAFAGIEDEIDLAVNHRVNDVRLALDLMSRQV